MEIRSLERRFFLSCHSKRLSFLLDAGFFSFIWWILIIKVFCLEQEQLYVSEMWVWGSLLAHSVSSKAKRPSCSSTSAWDSKNFQWWVLVPQTHKFWKRCATQQTRIEKKINEGLLKFMNQIKPRRLWKWALAWLSLCFSVRKIPYLPYDRKGRKPSSHLAYKQLPFWQYPVWMAAQRR